ncbi:hypothetical protein A2634_02880 [Candidatus Amesbacteria bacterium RIFCSPHIGHO2_01_FULL_48_32]|uniref:Uncharacterized protein n=1 Tax=Candidatus Amesbacteria bacterium RIFCSPLOWO2_01_FULL_48_25 TaxID=1797259 RepID=A0A1F4ZB20_9BACT|nr:MAG: hypothetical protein A2634_02880 [Candidatus Amesbacteria bacterium RIFCSPHIGHO2_01_FULL_48_32]OGD03087.1 MAG: hypothetical protein A2989_02100 [Candidatus Amesbacteria bacterium RIFCSPLOWO2_01_FULL_48_25]
MFENPGVDARCRLFWSGTVLVVAVIKRIFTIDHAFRLALKKPPSGAQKKRPTMFSYIYLIVGLSLAGLPGHKLHS